MEPLPQRRPLGYNASLFETAFGSTAHSPGNGGRLPITALPPSPPIVGPTPLPRRPKGRFFVGIVLLAAFGLVGWGAWQTFFRYDAYGIVIGRTVNLAPSQDAILREVKIMEGDAVKKGQPLATLDNLELRLHLAQLADELKVAEADLQQAQATRTMDLLVLRQTLGNLGDQLRVARADVAAAAVEVKWRSAYYADRYQQAAADYQVLWGKWLNEVAALGNLKAQLDRINRLSNLQYAVSQAEIDRIRFGNQGQAQLVEKLQSAVGEQEKRTQVSKDLLENGRAMTAPTEEKVKMLEGEIARLEERIERMQNDDAALAFKRARIELVKGGIAQAEQRIAACEIRSPVDGVVLHRLHLPGEAVKAAEPSFNIVETGSLEIALYLTQNLANSFQVGQDVTLVLEPYAEPLHCKVRRLGDEETIAPATINHFYRANEALLPVYLAAAPEDAARVALRVGAVVKLERSLRGNYHD